MDTSKQDGIQRTLETLNLSNRVYDLRYSLQDHGTFHNERFDLQDFMERIEDPKGCTEHWYSIQEEIDQLMGLKPGEVMTIRLSRDEPTDGMGAIFRVL